VLHSVRFFLTEEIHCHGTISEEQQ